MEIIDGVIQLSFEEQAAFDQFVEKLEYEGGVVEMLDSRGPDLFERFPNFPMKHPIVEKMLQLNTLLYEIDKLLPEE